jgi:hypothetical protein
MADGKTAERKALTPLEQLDQAHAAAQKERQLAIEAATEELRAADVMMREARLRVATLQQEKMNASFAYDAKRAELVAKAEAPKAA